MQYWPALLSRLATIVTDASRRRIPLLVAMTTKAAMHSFSALQAFANACRRGLEMQIGKEGSVFRTFPEATCGDTSHLIGRLLDERLGLTGVVVCGYLPRLHRTPEGIESYEPLGDTHAWFETSDFIIDLTHDQFADSGLSGWVHPVACAWYKRFNHRNVLGDYCGPGTWSFGYPFDAYEAMSRELDCLAAS